MSLSSSVTLHHDNRSEDYEFKRDKQHTAKWAMGIRPSGGVYTTVQNTPLTGSPEQQAKTRPEKKWSERDPNFKCHANLTKNPKAWSKKGLATGRAFRQQDAKYDASTLSPTLSKSLFEDLPSGNSSQNARTPPVDSGITYSFDAKSSPRNAVGLDSLVEKAEREFLTRETEKLVNKEYEVLDHEGEPILKKGKKGSHLQAAVVLDEEDGWERV